MKYHILNQLLSEIFRQTELEDKKRVIFYKYKYSLNWEIWWGSRHIDYIPDEAGNNLIAELLKELENIDYSLEPNCLELGLNVGHTFRIELERRVLLDSTHYLFNLKHLNPYEKLTKLGKSFDEI
jgi:hypothetical protein